MVTRTFALLLLASCVVDASSIGAQRPDRKVVRLGYIGNAAPPAETHQEEALFSALRKLGWVEGQTLSVERRYWESRRDRLPTIMQEFVRLKLEIVVTSTGSAALAAKRATSTIPIVTITSGDAVLQGLVASLARPGGNVTGLTNISTDTNERRMILLKDVVPNLSAVAVLGCSLTNPLNSVQWNDARAAAKALGLQVQPAEIKGPQEIEQALSAATRMKVGALFVHDCTQLPSRESVAMAVKFRLPAIYPSERFMDAGGLMTYGPNLVEMASRAADYVDRILKGAKPADLPVERPKKFDFIINLKAAKQIGLPIPPNVLVRADRVIR